MKITGLEVYRADGGWQPYTFVRVTTDTDYCGWSEINEARGREGLSAYLTAVSRSVVGLDPRNRNLVRGKLMAITRAVAGPLSLLAAGAIENACIDIHAKSLGVPVYELLGGAVRDDVTVYWSHCGLYRVRWPELFDGHVIDAPSVRNVADITRLGAEVADAGFSALKTNLLVCSADGASVRLHSPGFNYGADSLALNFAPADMKGVAAHLRALRTGAGDDVQMALDVGFSLRPEAARRLAHHLAEFDLMWLEIDSQEPELLAQIRREVATGIASLETVLGVRNFRNALEHSPVDVAIIDPQWNGVGEATTMAAIAESRDLNVAPHFSGGPLGAIMCAHFARAVPNLQITEFDVDRVPWAHDLLTDPFPLIGDRLHTPPGPGWGTEIALDVVAEHPVTR